MLTRYNRNRGGLARYVAPTLGAAAGYIAPSLSRVPQHLGKTLRGFVDGYQAGAQDVKSKTQTPLIMDIPRSSEVYAPVAISTRQVSRRARISSGRGKKPTVITHRELIDSSITGSTTFTLYKRFALNPGLAATFPWLSTQAAQYEEYRFRSLSFSYVPIAPTSTQGDIHLAVDYDPVNTAPTTEVQMLDHPNSTSDSVWRNIPMKLDISSMHSTGTRKFVRTAAVPSDLKTFDCGNFIVASNNETSTAVIGKLFVEYTVELYAPFIGPQPGSLPSTVSMFTNSGVNQAYTTTVTAQQGFATTVYNPLGIVANGNSFTLPNGTWRVRYGVQGHDSVNEVLQVISQITQNGASLVPDLRVINNAGPNDVNNEGSAIVVVNSTASSLIALAVSLAGAAGVLTTTGSGTWITFEVV